MFAASVSNLLTGSARAISCAWKTPGAAARPQILLTIQAFVLQPNHPNFQDYRNVAIAYEASAPDLENSSCIIVLHGGGRNGISAARTQTKFDLLAAETGDFMVVYPEAILDKGPDGQPGTEDDRYNWNDGRDVSVTNTEEGDPVYDPNYQFHDDDHWGAPIFSQNYQHPDMTRGMDDVGFLAVVVDKMIAGFVDTEPSPDVNVGCNPDRIYMVGLSNGGMMAQRFVLEKSRLIAAASTVVGNLVRQNESIATAEPIPMLVVLGRKDLEQRFTDWDLYADDPPPFGPSQTNPWIPEDSPFAGGWVCNADEEDAPVPCTCGAKMGRVNAASGTRNFWVDLNGCTLTDQTQLGSTNVFRYRTGCSEDLEVQYYDVGNGGHSPFCQHG